MLFSNALFYFPAVNGKQNGAAAKKDESSEESSDDDSEEEAPKKTEGNFSVTIFSKIVDNMMTHLARFECHGEENELFPKLLS